MDNSLADSAKKVSLDLVSYCSWRVKTIIIVKRHCEAPRPEGGASRQ